ncbi:MAG: hypothetical protein U0992_15070 [Planctomycetaceae bacterium]
MPPQSLERRWIKAVVAEMFAETFFGNCTGLGFWRASQRAGGPRECGDNRDRKSASTGKLDLEGLTFSYGDFSVPITMPKSPHEALVSGQWDFLGQLLDNTNAIRERAQAIPYLREFAV